MAHGNACYHHLCGAAEAFCARLVGVYRPSDFISGGYFLAKRVPRPTELDEQLPDTLLTLSNCFTDIAPDCWAMSGYKYDAEERAAEAAKFGIPVGSVSALVREFSEAVGPQHCNAFPSLSVAQQFYENSTDKPQVMLVGIGLHPTLLRSLLSQRSADVNNGYGLLERVELGNRLDETGTSLGFELLGYSGTHFHSWLCHDATRETFQQFGVRPNQDGFLDSMDDAVRATEHLRITGAEPAIWEPWLIVKYPET
jgi:hypothetical protein